MPEVVAEEPDEPAEEPRRVGRDHDRPVEPTQEPARDGEWIRPGGRRLEDGHGIGGEVGPAGVAAGTGALQQREAGQVPEPFGDVDRARGGEAVRQAPETQWRIASGARDHRRMIRPVDPPSRRVASPDGSSLTGAADGRLAPVTTVRPATTADLPALAAILAAHGEAVEWPDRPGWPYLEHLLGYARVPVAVVDGAVIGFAGLDRVRGGRGPAS